MNSKFQFGNSDAAIYLADYLMKKNDRYETRKVSAKLSEFNRYANELIRSNLSPKLKVWALRKLWKDFIVPGRHHFTDDKLINDLIANVATGKVREIFRALKESDPKSYSPIIGKIGEYTPTNQFL